MIFFCVLKDFLKESTFFGWTILLKWSMVQCTLFFLTLSFAYGLNLDNFFKSSETRLICVDLCVEGENRVISVKVHQGRWDLSPAVHKAYRSDCKMAFHKMTQEALPSWGSAVPHRPQITAHHSAPLTNSLWVRTGTVTAGFEFKGAVIYSQILWLVEDQWFVEM